MDKDVSGSHLMRPWVLGKESVAHTIGHKGVKLRDQTCD